MAASVVMPMSSALQQSTAWGAKAWEVMLPSGLARLLHHFLQLLHRVIESQCQLSLQQTALILQDCLVTDAYSPC